MLHLFFRLFVSQVHVTKVSNRTQELQSHLAHYTAQTT